MFDHASRRIVFDRISFVVCDQAKLMRLIEGLAALRRYLARVDHELAEGAYDSTVRF